VIDGVDGCDLDQAEHDRGGVDVESAGADGAREVSLLDDGVSFADESGL
jgi:hypothetical protein